MLETLAAIGEFVGGTAVLVTIVYLAFQLRANLKANKAQALSAWTMAALSEKEVLYRDPSFTSLYRRAVIENETLEGDELIRFTAYCIQLMNSWQLAFIQCELGVFDSEFMDNISQGYASFMTRPNVQQWWNGGGSDSFDVRFVAYVGNFAGQPRS